MSAFKNAHAPLATGSPFLSYFETSASSVRSRSAFFVLRLGMHPRLTPLSRPAASFLAGVECSAACYQAGTAECFLVRIKGNPESLGRFLYTA